ncbi:MAG: hypothetical protein MHM6MM_004748 [Cercozoa sp. M6MM]
MGRRRGGGMGSRRRSSGGLFGSSSRSAKPAPTRAAQPRAAPRTTSPVPQKKAAPAKQEAPKPAQQTPAAAPQQSSGGGLLSGIGSTIMQGMAFGAGSSVAHRAVDAVMGPREHVVRHEGGEEHAPLEQAQAQQEQPQGPCAFERQEMQRCMQDQSMQCDFFYNKLKECQSQVYGAQQQSANNNDGFYAM